MEVEETHADMVSPVGTPAARSASDRAAKSERYRAQRARFATTRELARQVILYRTEMGLSQQDLADRIGTSRPVISRIESGRYMPSGTTLQRLAEALGKKLRIVLEKPDVFARRKQAAERARLSPEEADALAAEAVEAIRQPSK